MVVMQGIRDKVDNYMSKGDFVVYIRKTGKYELKIGIVTELVWGMVHKVRVRGYDINRERLNLADSTVIGTDCLNVGSAWRFENPDGYYRVFGGDIDDALLEFWQENILEG